MSAVRLFICRGDNIQMMKGMDLIITVIETETYYKSPNMYSIVIQLPYF